MIKFKTKIPIYFGELLVLVNDDFNEALKIEKIIVDGDFSGCYGLAIATIHTKTNKTQFVICLTTTPTHSTIAHEALHTTHDILKSIAAQSDMDNDETTCYLLDWIIEQIYTGLKKYKVEVTI